MEETRNKVMRVHSYYRGISSIFQDAAVHWKAARILRTHLRWIVTIIFTTGICLVQGQSQLENIDRGMVAVSTSDTSVFISWRMLGTDPDTVAFNVYRGDIRINEVPVSNSTNFEDINGSPADRYHVVTLLGGTELESSDTVSPWPQQFMTIPLQRPAGGTNPSGSYSYSPNDASVGDLDGDGEYEIVLKWDPSNSKDNSQSGYTGNVILDGYELDGTHMWRIDLGINIRAGAHYTQFMVYDLDGDGKAEVACKTAPGTKDATGNYLKLGPAGGADHTADYRNSSGYILSGPEYFTIFDGETGNELVTVDYIPPRGSVSSWGDDYGNRVDRFLACVAYLDGSRPSVVMCRGYYTRTVLAAWDWREGQLTSRWIFDSNNGYPTYAGQGNHNLSVADVDNDGKDEIVYGSMAVDDDGTGLWNARLGHGDAMHLSDIDPDRPGLEVWGIHENAQVGSALLDARTGAIIWGTGPADVGRGVSADLDSLHLGMECWGGTDGLRSVKNQKVGNTPGSSNHVIWWDGDLTRELLNDNYIDKYGTGLLLTASGCSSNNGTKSNPSLQADILGDWREEVIFRTSDNTALRLYTTTDTTKYRIKTLMHDRVYREGIAWQNVAYNQPPHTGFYLGADMFVPDSLRPPSAPMNVLASALNDTVKLQWSENLESDLAGYHVYRSKNRQGPFGKLTAEVLAENNFTDTAVFNDTAYYYAVAAVDTSDNESRFSLIIKAIPSIRPDMPFGIYTRNDAGKLKLFWAPDTTGRVTGYNIYRAESEGGDYILLNAIPVTGNEYLDSPLSDNATHYYVIRSVDNNSVESFDSPQIAAAAGPVTHMQAEEGITSGGWIESNNLGFNGTGFFNFDTRDTYIEFINIGGNEGGPYMLVYRYALGSSNRTGALSINGVSRSLTMFSTQVWTTYVLDSVRVELKSGFTNTIRFASTGADFGNLDEITVKPALPTRLENFEVSEQLDITGIYPNPLTDYTTIEYLINEPCEVTIQILNILGQPVKTLVNGNRYEGMHEVVWNAQDESGKKLPGGIYFCRFLINNEFSAIQRLMLLCN
jgi:hypothetical protein